MLFSACAAWLFAPAAIPSSRLADRRGPVIARFTRPVLGLCAIVTVAAVVGLSVSLFRGSFTDSVDVVVIAQRAGLVMNPDAKVKMRDIQVGTVKSIREQADGHAAIELSLDPAAVPMIPRNIRVDIASTTVFGAKFVQLIPPAAPASESVQPGQVLDAEHVTVEINTVFERLTLLLDTIEPEKLNGILTSINEGIGGRGGAIGSTIEAVTSLLGTVEPHLPALSQDLALAPEVLDIYSDSMPDLLALADNTSALSRTLVDQQQQLDTFLLSAIGIATTGSEVVAANSQPVATVLRLLAPTTELLDEYRDALYCSLATMLDLQKENAPLEKPGAIVLTGFNLAAERYRYPTELPKVAATGGPQCVGLPKLPFETRIPFVVADTGANPFKYNNPGILLNADGLKQMLFGPIAGPPRNTAQIGQPG
ncbi:MCE family protein [Mycobacterium sp. 236(2023)]|uniref:MCE family protein n=1 Tax=Mycobacterium sp. 236(2023) TaxID=3038163 RepID=UPI002414EE38|nr:MCE family protein [Mycobacterium sp. 236(2023)]MDG4669269.1 MCE family protein [Mycobacterium sp. 236(2023)]